MKTAFAVLLFALSLLVSAAAGADEGVVKAVYHVDDWESQTFYTLRSLRSHLQIDPKAQLHVVTYANGIDFLMLGASNSKGEPYAKAVQELIAQGVVFKVCNNTLLGRDIPRDRILPEVQIVPSGTVEIIELQSKRGFAYIKP